MPKDGETSHPEVWYQQVQQRYNYEALQPQYTKPLLPRETGEFVCFLQPRDQQTFPIYPPAKLFSADYADASPQPSPQPESSTQRAPPYNPVDFASLFTPFDARFIPKGMAGQSSELFGDSNTATQIASVAFDHLYPGEGQEDRISLDCPLCGGKPSQCSLVACTTNDQKRNFGTTSAYSGNMYGSSVTADQSYNCADIPLGNGMSATLPQRLV